ncbi:30S ribosomal protein S1 [Neptunomonas phycophila]|uniref:30S ribosomal protein S1 n=1 Tax=Neptunomonas phycophila TaxID=1572645 RepID=A0AAW7XMZ6_9GAMM|nr:30S ribosomal protein S1 [Neptunomonas phycophila]MDO6454372.1 30S ribosomal protein S1 [Neptunomonas phycophila]MDO6467248.1 30S ribosomal protein S1 [Neptunomonas phycophila]MDO6782660.1 30S ribosomal protein S1 [Neptunomonas phycophila]MDP2522023.1 30S ribosomal protein S1 [Neptunomonas phycophila]
MSESFADLFEESLQELNMAPGSIVTGTVIAIENDFVIVNAGLKSEGVIPREQFIDEQGELTIAVGDEVKVALESVEDGFGATQLSREKAKRAEAWAVLETAFENGEIIKGEITGKVRGGFTVAVGAVSAFLPGSLLDIRPLRDSSHLEGKELEFKLVKLDVKRNNIVVSRRAVLEELNSADREKLLETLEEGIVLKGIVKNITDYGAFIDLGGIDGLLHITDIAWKRVKHPSEVLSVGDEIDVKVLKYDREKTRVSLGIKQLKADPWDEKVKQFNVGDKTTAKVTNLTDYGCFAQIAEGIEGLVHVSEMDWTNKNVHPSKVVQVGQEVEVMVLDIDTDRRRISLGMKQCQQNPWDAFAASHQKGEKITGKIKSITDFGVFVGLDGNIDGLVHLSDLSWDLPGEEAVKQFNKGDEVEAVVVSIDVERERIALSIKQLNGDPLAEYLAAHKKGDIVKGTVTEVDARQATIEIADGVEASLRVAEWSRERTDDLTNEVKVGDQVDAVIISMDSKNRTINLSVKQMELKQEREALQNVQQQSVDSAGPTTIGDLIKQQMNKK